MNLSAWRYRSLLAHPSDGPIRRMVLHTLGDVGYETCVFLRSDLKPARYSNNRLYGTCDGSGWSRYKHESVFKAISEALERWAFYAFNSSPDKAYFGFDVDSSTTGMAAFPAFSTRPARFGAFLEAVERWSLGHWWLGELPTRQLPASDLLPGISVFEIVSPWSPKTRVVLLYSMIRDQGLSFATYGFSAGTDLARAIERACTEHRRNKVSLEVFLRDEAGNALSDVTDIYERRVLHFALGGYERFRWRLQKSLMMSQAQLPEVPGLIIDREVRGPWSRYATVWRCLFDPRAVDPSNEAEDFFLF